MSARLTARSMHPRNVKLLSSMSRTVGRAGGCGEWWAQSAVTNSRPSIMPDGIFIEPEPIIVEPEDDTTCAICLSADAAPLCMTPCGHLFCEVCLGTYAMRRIASPKLASRSLPCPLCRSALTEKDIPDTISLTLTRSPGGSFGLTVVSNNPAEPGVVRVKAVTAYPAITAGLCKGLRIMAVGHAEPRTAIQFSQLAAEHPTSMQLTLGDLRWITAVALAMAEQAAPVQSSPLPPPDASAAPSNPGIRADLLCWSIWSMPSVAALLWQRSLRLPPSRCVVAAIALNLMFGFVTLTSFYIFWAEYRVSALRDSRHAPSDLGGTAPPPPAPPSAPAGHPKWSLTPRPPLSASSILVAVCGLILLQLPGMIVRGEHASNQRASKLHDSC